MKEEEKRENGGERGAGAGGSNSPKVRDRHSLSPTTHVQCLFATACVFFTSFVMVNNSKQKSANIIFTNNGSFILR